MSHQIDNDTHKLTTMTWESKVTIKSETTTGTTPRGMLEQEYFEMKYAKFLFEYNNYFTELVSIILFYNK